MKEYIAYTQKNAKDRLVTGAAGAVFAAAGAACLNRSRITGMILIVLGVLAVCSGLLQGGRNRKAMAKLMETGEMEKVLKDFTDAEDLTEDAKAGKIWIFRRKYADPLKIADIAEAEYAEKAGDRPGTKEAGIYLKLKNGKAEKLCSIYGPDPRTGSREILAVLSKKNPDISIR